MINPSGFGKYPDKVCACGKKFKPVVRRQRSCSEKCSRAREKMLALKRRAIP
jgi:hypothetical protein